MSRSEKDPSEDDP